MKGDKENPISNFSEISEVSTDVVYFVCEQCKKVSHKRKAIIKSFLLCRTCITKNNNLRKYGVENVSQLQSIKDKKKETCLNHFGVEYSWQSSIVKEKIKKTNIERFGTDNPAKSDKIKQKIEKTNIERYGTKCSLNNDDVRKKAKETCVKHYGVEYSLSSEEVQNKAKKTIEQKYGVSNVGQNEEIKAKIKDTLVERYGVENAYQIPEIKAKQKKIFEENQDSILQKMQDTFLKKYGVKNPMQNESIRKSVKHKFYFDNNTFDSNDEILFYKRLKDMGVDFEMQVKYPKAFIINDKENFTYIDFYLSEKDMYIEIKGRHFFDENFLPQFPYKKGKYAESGKLKWEKKFEFLIKENVNIIVVIDNKFFNVTKGGFDEYFN